MAVGDVKIKENIAWLVLPVAVILITMFYFKGYLNGLRLRFMAWILNVLGKRSNRFLEKHKKELFNSMKKLKATVGDDLYVLEVGVGGGANFQFYPPGTRVTCLDPNPYLKNYNEMNADSGRVKMKGFVKGYAEDMREIEDCSYDVVVSTLVMCSVRDTKQVISEVKRVLKFNGKFYFMDHVAARNFGIIYLMQKIMNPIWYVLTRGCEVTRTTGQTVKEHGNFKSVDLQYFNIPIWYAPVLRPFVMGIATK